MTKKGGAPQLDRWRRSSEFREIARRQAIKLNRERSRKPKCGAKRKTDGEPCQNAGMGNGRCYRHGGKTPKGDKWHVRQWPDKRDALASTKLENKLQWQERRAGQRAKRVSKMTADERAAYELWKRTHQPGKAAARKLKRQDAKSAADFRALAAHSETKNISEEAASLRAYMLQLEAEDRRLQKLIDSENLGAFG